MLHDKGTIKIRELQKGFSPRWLELDFVIELFGAFKFGALIKGLNKLKVKGYKVESIFSILILLPFIGESSVGSLLNSRWSTAIKGQKDTFYRLKNNTMLDWRKILWLFALRFVKIMDTSSCNNNGQRCLIIDDTLLPKTGKRIEKIGKVWDHVLQRSVLGFKLLVMGYWDGVSMIPIDFSLHREKGKNKEKLYGMTKSERRRQFQKSREINSPGRERELELEMNKVNSALCMFKRAMARKLKVDYVLMDSWFTCELFVKAVKAVKHQCVHLIGMYKNPNTQFEYKGQKLTCNQIRGIGGKVKRCRKARYYYLEAEVLYNKIPVKLFITRQGKNGKWKVFMTTDMKISFSRLIEVYHIRWTIEVFNKESKQLLGLGKCQANDFDSQIAETTTTMIQYIMLSLRHRFDRYESKGVLFKQTRTEVFDTKLNERLWGLFLELINLIEELFKTTDEIDLMERIFNDCVAWERIMALFSTTAWAKNLNAA